ncbi:uncharacterized protein LOC114441149 [Parambassis ranga]|uniref:Uncharacterized protein LOC114441149 n=1 Tax=Parambassis ranga TaxID=210632 RepID=A0A6P7IZJ3_9TELE|nr:uncharacterized protein LOC114441149 [Parambassis ranga]
MLYYSHWLPVQDSQLCGIFYVHVVISSPRTSFPEGLSSSGQLGLGEDHMQISTPCRLNCSQLSEVTQIQAGDSYSAAITAGGELLLWGQIPSVSRVSNHTGLKSMWTPQPVPLAGRKVSNVACGTWHMMALTTKSKEKNRQRAQPDTETHFRDLVSNPLPTEHTEKENTAQDFRQVQHKLLEKPEESEKQQKDKESPKEEERHGQNKKEGNGEFHNVAVALLRSASGMDTTRNVYSSINFDPGVERDGFKTTESWERRNKPCRSKKSSSHVVFTTLHLLPRSEGEQRRPAASTLPQVLTGQQVQCRVLAQAQEERSPYLTELVQTSGSNSHILQSPRLRPKPRPPGRSTGPGAQRVTSSHRSRIRPHHGPESQVYNTSLQKLSPGPYVQVSTTSSHQGAEVFLSSAVSSSGSEPCLHCPTHRKDTSFSTSWKSASESK